MSAAVNQDFTVYAGDVAVVVFVVSDGPDGTGNPVDLSACSDIWWTAARNLDDQTTIILQKKLSTGGISLVGGGTGGKFSVSLLATDTASLTLAYAHTAITYDDLGNPSTVATGQMFVKPKPTASFSGDPAQGKRDYVRSLVGDDNVDSPIYTDQVYDNLFTTFGGPLYVAAQICRMLAAKYSAKATKRVGDLSINYGDLAKNYIAAAAQFRAQADLGGVLYVSGISKSDKMSYSPRFNPDAIGSFTTLEAYTNKGAIGGFMPPNGGGDSE